MQFAVHAHRAHLFPDGYGVSGRPGVRISVQEQQRSGILVEAEFGREGKAVVIAAAGVVPIQMSGIIRLLLSQSMVFSCGK